MRAKRRDATSTILTDPNGVAYLDILNSAITTVLESRTWDFQKRKATLTTVPPFTGTNISATAGSNIITFSDYTGTADTVSGQFVVRIIGIGDPTYGNTAMQLDTTSLVVTTVLGVLTDDWQGGSTFTSWKTLTYEYVLPSTVREVLAVKNIETDEPLIFSNSPEEFEEAFPRPWDELSDQPQVACVGGEMRNTEVLGGGSQDFGLCLRVWPVPSAEYQLDYTYVYRQAKLASSTDNLERVPPAVEDVIVDLAVARVITELEKDIQTGIPLEAKVLKQIDALHRNHVPAAGRRPEILSHEAKRSTRNALLWLPRRVTALAGS